MTSLQGPSRVAGVLAGNIIPELFATIFFGARVFSRIWLLKSWGADDTVLSISWLASVILCIMSCLGTKYGTGHHIADIPANFVIPTLKIGFGSLIVYQISLGLTKISICLFYARVFSDKTSRRLVYGTIAVIILYTTPTVLFSIFHCNPVSGAWDTSTIPTPVCQDTTPAFWANGICNIAVDAWLIIMIVPRVWTLQIVPRAKVALCGIITMGWLVMVAAILRMVKLHKVFSEPSNVADASWTFYDVTIWTGLEVAMGIFCASAPAVRPILKQYAPGFMSSLGNLYGNSASAHGISTATAKRNKWPSSHSGAIELSDKEQDERYTYGIGHGRSESQYTKWLESDADSTTDVLRPENKIPGVQNIMKKVEITVEVQDNPAKRSTTPSLHM